MPAKYAQVISRPKGTIETFIEDSSLAASRTGLTVTTMVASVLEGRGVTVNSQTYTAASNQLAFQLSFANAGTAVVQVKTTFDSSDEATMTWYKFRTIAHELPLSDYA